MDLVNLKLNNWNKMTVKADVEEKPEDIALAIVYADHGDDFVYVKTKNGEQFLYGYFLGRRGEADDLKDFENSGSRYKETFIRKPNPFFKEDTRSSVSNEVFHILHDEKMFEWGSDRPVKSTSPQWRFDYMLNRLDAEYAKGIFYNLDRGSDNRNRIRRWLEFNEIATPENLDALEKAKFSTKNEDGLDGIAGKKVIRFFCPGFDDVKAVYKDGVELPMDEVIRLEDDDPDEYGYCSTYIPTDQFDDGIEEKLAAEIIDLKEEIEQRLSDINVENVNLEKLYLIKQMLYKVEIYEPVPYRNVYDDYYYEE